ncbi:MAG: hypothetical protein K2P76_04610 [Lachnospiraceae bacterium]|nr:hypothetical protein [Lachnospiraceae bacterium]MDE6982337.1 hypothetical protein [Lachnospiraceae bacterium]
MKKVNCIRILCVLAVVVLILVLGYLGNRAEKEIPPDTEQIVPTEIPVDTEPSLTVNHNINYKYVIIEEGDYLTVYYADRKTVYEYTDIRYSDLEDTLRQKIRKGYWIEDEEQLYGFLENYDT